MSSTEEITQEQPQLQTAEPVKHGMSKKVKILLVVILVLLLLWYTGILTVTASASASAEKMSVKDKLLRYFK